MEVTWLYCHVCRNVQRDRRASRDHLLRVHGKVARRGSDVPVRLEGRELEVVWTSVHPSRTSGPARAARQTEALGPPRVSDREAERRLHDNRARTARHHRAAARAREEAPAPLTAPEVPATTDLLQDTADDTRHVLLLGSTQADPPTVAPPGRTYSPCARCLNCSCREPKNYSEAQASSPVRGLHTSRRRSSSSRRVHRRPPRTPSPGPPLLWREAQQDEGPTDMPSWDVAQAEYSQGAKAMSQGSAGSPVLFLDPAACDDVLADLRGDDGCLPTFSDSERGSPPPMLEAEVTHLNKGTQTPSVRCRDRSSSAPPISTFLYQPSNRPPPPYHLS